MYIYSNQFIKYRFYGKNVSLDYNWPVFFTYNS
jgi:hypothetical protein